jgi:hypothetical protein
MIGNSVCLRVKRGKPGRHSANWLYESEGKTELQILGKTSDRELLSHNRPKNSSHKLEHRATEEVKTLNRLTALAFISNHASRPLNPEL